MGKQVMEFVQLLMERIQLLEDYERIVGIEDELASYMSTSLNGEISYNYRQIRDLYDKICGRGIYSDVSQNESSYENEETLKIFSEAVFDFDIENFLKTNPVYSPLSPGWEHKVGDFMKTINCKIQNKSVNMVTFILKLDEYKEYVCDNTHFDDIEKIINNTITEISQYRSQLHSLYKEICGVDISFED